MAFRSFFEMNSFIGNSFWKLIKYIIIFYLILNTFTGLPWYWVLFIALFTVVSVGYVVKDFLDSLCPGVVTGKKKRKK